MTAELPNDFSGDFSDDLNALHDKLNTLLGSLAPDAEFENRMVTGLQRARMRITNWINPQVRRAAISAAAVVALATMGYMGSNMIQPGSGDFSFLEANDPAVEADYDHSANSSMPVTQAGSNWDFNVNEGEASSSRSRKSGGRSEPSESRVDGRFLDVGGQSQGLGSRGEHVDEQKKNSSFGRGDLTFTGETIVSPGKLQAPTGASSLEGKFDYTIIANPSAIEGAELTGATKISSRESSAGVIKTKEEAQKITAGKDVVVASAQTGKQVEETVDKKLSELKAPEPVSPPTPDAQQPAPNPAPPAAEKLTNETLQRKIIRNGDMLFEVDSFDSSLMTLTKLAAEDGGFVASTDSSKLPNGKTRGTIVVRMPPDRLDVFVLKLRGMGDLKTQKISAQDVTKQYTDIESQLRAARAMEERLLDMIKKGNGAIKDLLAAEKELGIWRGKIEQMEGEKRYYDNLVSLCTLNITLQERDIRAASGAIETETITTGVETEDVEKARAEALKAIEEVKGRVIGADLKKLDAGQYSATITAEVPSESSGVVVDRLRQLGRVARLDVDRKQCTPDGSAAPIAGSKVEKKPTTLSIHIYNLANVAPRHSSQGVLVVNDVEAVYRTLLEKIEKVNGRVITSAIARPSADQLNATIRFETKSADADAMLNDLRGAGEMMNLNLTENSDTANTTNAKQGFDLRIVGLVSVAPRETTQQQIVAQHVGETHLALQESAMKLGGRVLVSSLNEGRRDQTQSRLEVEVPRTALSDWQKTLDASGNSMSRNVSRSTDTQNTIDSKVRFSLTIYALDSLPPRQNTSSVIRVTGAEQSAALLSAQVQTLGGRVKDSNLSKDSSGRSVSHIVVDVPQAKSAEVLAVIRQAGELVSMTNSTSADVPDGTLAQARFDVNFTEASVLVGKEDGLWSNLRDGLSTSIKGLAWSVRLLVVGVCLVAPWALILWGIWKFTRKGKAVPSKA